MNLKLISCEIFYREMCHAVATSPHRIDIEFLPKGLHDLKAEEMRERVQAVIDATDPGGYDAILLGFALCNNGLAGIRAPSIPLILPRAHDCISLFMGSRFRYQEYFDANPGTYFLTSGWIERGETTGELAELTIQNRNGIGMSMEELIEQYGADNAEYLYDMLSGGTEANYHRFNYIHMGIEPPNIKEEAVKRAQERGWDFEETKGDLCLIGKLVNGEWDDSDFLTVPPGKAIKPSFDDSIVKAV